MVAAIRLILKNTAKGKTVVGVAIRFNDRATGVANATPSGVLWG